jgi:Putative zinc-finger
MIAESTGGSQGRPSRPPAPISPPGPSQKMGLATARRRASPAGPPCYDQGGSEQVACRAEGERSGVELIPHVARCDECVELLVDYISGELPPERARALEIHLDLCPSCVSFVNTYRGTVNIARTLQPDDIPPEVTQRLIDFLRKEKEAPHRPD